MPAARQTETWAQRRDRLRRRKRRARLHRLLLLIAALLIVLGVGVPAGVVYYACYTEDGTQLIVSLIPRKIGDTGVQIAGVKGTLAHGLRIERVEVDERLVTVLVEGVHGHVTLADLLWQEVRSPDAAARRVTVIVNPHPAPPKKRTPPSFLPRWLVIRLDQAKIAESDVVLPNGTVLNGMDLVTSTILRHTKIQFFSAKLKHDDIELSGLGVLRAGDPLKLDGVDLRMHWSPTDQPDWLFTGTFKGDLNSLEMNVHTVQPFRSDFSGRMLSITHGDRWRWLGNATVRDFDLAAWHTAGPLGVINGQLHLQGNRHNFIAQGTATPQGLHAGPFDVFFQGYYQNHALTAENMEVRHQATGARAQGHGTFGIVPHGPDLDIQGSWQDFRWPLTGPDSSVAFHSPAADFTISGMLPYKVTAKGIGRIASLPAMPMQIADGTLERDGFKLGDGTIGGYGGHARVRGEVIWSGEQSWSLESEVADLSLGTVREDLPGHVSFSVAAHGDSFASTQDLDIDIRDLTGTVRGQSARGSGHMARTKGSWEFDNLLANLGRTRLSLDGVLGETMDLRFSVAADDLSLISPTSSGLLRAKGTLHGTLEMPVVEATVNGTNIRHDGVTLDSLEAGINFDPHPQREATVNIHVRNLRHQRRTLDSFDLVMTGRPEGYAVHSEAKAEGLDAVASGIATYAHGQLTGQIDHLAVRSKDTLHLTLARPVSLRLSAGRAQLDKLCLTGTASVCAEGEWARTPAQWSARLSADELPIESLTSGLSATQVTYEGTVNVQAHLWDNDGGPVQGSMQADLSNAQLVHTLASGRVEHTEIGSGIIVVEAGRTSVTGTATLKDGQIGTLKASLTAQRDAEDWQGMPVQGEVHAETRQLDLLSLYQPDIDRAAGHLKADAQVAGTLGAPRLAGELRLADAEMDLYQLNLRLRQLQLHATLTDNGVDFTSQARIGEGSVTTAGRLEWHDKLPYGQLTMQGRNLRVMDVPEAHIDASPDLRFVLSGSRMEVTGDVDVPYARIMPRDLSSGVGLSSDQVLVNGGSAPPTRRAEILSSINLRLGDKVNIVTSGLTARLKGTVAVKSGYEAATSATGQLSVVEGKYVAYAHNFDIQSGTLIFTGGPVDNPGIDIKAARKFPDVTAGVKVRGTLIQPRISFFSEPSLPQAEIASLILSGGSLESAQSRDRTGGAGNEALVQGGAILLQQLSSQVGIEDVGVQSDPYNTNDTSLVLGKYLSPRLYVSYGVGLTEQLQVLKLRYSLGDHWTVATEVGQARGADLEFSINR